MENVEINTQYRWKLRREKNGSQKTRSKVNKEIINLPKILPKTSTKHLRFLLTKTYELNKHGFKHAKNSFTFAHCFAHVLLNHKMRCHYCDIVTENVVEREW